MNRLRPALQLAGIVVLLLSPPTVLTVVVGNPLPSWPIDWGLVGESLMTGAIAPATWLKVIATVAWLVWGWLVAAVAVDLIASVQGRTSPIRFVPVHAIVAAILTLSGQLTGHQSAAWADPASSPATQVDAPTDPETRSDSDAAGVDVPDGWQLVTVDEGDSWAGWADRTIGDPSAGSRLREANVGRDVGGHVVDGSEPFVTAGWQLLVPVVDTPADTSPAPQAPPRATVREVDVTSSTSDELSEWQVAPGDHFWAIAATTLEDEFGRAPTDAEIAPYWRQLVDANTDRLLPPGDPDLIYPGQRLLVPPVGGGAQPTSAPADSSASAEEAPAAIDGHGTPAADTVGQPDEASQGRDQLPSDLPSDDPVSDELGRSATGWQGALSGHAIEPAADDIATDDEPDVADKTAWGVPVELASGVAATGLLAAGAVALLRRRRRTALQQRPHGLRLPTPSPAGEAAVARLEAAAPPDPKLDDLATLLGSIPAGVTPALVTATDDGLITLLFDERVPIPDPPPPWSLVELGADAPVGWRARLGDRGPTRSVGLPLLVTAGRAEVGAVLANVGAMGSLAVTGEPASVRTRLRAITMEVALSRVAGPVDVTVAGDDLLADLDQVRVVQHPETELAAAAAERAEGVVAEDRVPRLLVCHLGVAPPSVPVESDGLVGVVGCEQAPGAGWVLELASDATGQLRLPDGGRLEVALPEADPELIVEEVARIDAARAGSAGEDVSADDGVVVTMPQSLSPRFVEVRLLGPLEVVRDGSLVDGLTPKTLELIAFLATHRDGVTREQLEDAVWAGRAAAHGSQRVKAALAKAREALGDGPDGEPLVPRRRSGSARLVLSPHVGTDLDRACARLAAARRLPEMVRHRELVAALELVRGEPFAGLAVSWATQVQYSAVAELQDAALAAAILSRRAGDWDTAQRAIEQGLLLCDPAEQLYLEWARIEIAQGRSHRVPHIQQRLRDRYAEEADEIAGYMASPSAQTELQFQALLAGEG